MKRRRQATQDLPVAPEVQAIFDRTVARMPELLAGMVNEKVSASTILKARGILLKASVEDGLVEEMAKFIPLPLASLVLGTDRPEEVAAKLKEKFVEILELLEEQAGAVDEMLEDAGVSQHDAMADPKIGFNEAALQALDAGNLTIGKLLEIQPLAVAGSVPTLSMS